MAPTLRNLIDPRPRLPLRPRAARAALFTALSLATAAVAPAISNAGAAVRIGQPPVLPLGAAPLAAAPDLVPLRVTVVLKPRDPGALARYAAAVGDPASPLYHRYITPAAFARRFAPAPSAAAAVLSALRAHGLNPGRRSANGLSIPLRATTGTLSRAFSLGFARIALARGRTALINTSAPAVDARIAGTVQAVLGLSSLSSPHPLLMPRATAALVRRARPALAAAARPHVATGGPQPCAAASSAAPGQTAYTADQIASAYGFSGLYRQGNEGQGETVGIYELEPDDPADIAAYQSCYGTATSVTYVPVDGGSGTGPGSGEAALDIEQLIGLAPKAHLVVYQGPNSNSGGPGSGPYDVFSQIVSEDRAQVVTNSWGECEQMVGQPDASAEAVLFEEAAAQGQTILSAAGDSGSEDCAGGGGLPVLQNELAVDDPGSQPFVTSVGGTSLSALGPPPTESVWNNGGNLGGLLGIEPGAGGGGISQLWRMPAYQSSAPASLRIVQPGFSSGAPCGSSGLCREVPDVSADADPTTGYLIYYNGSGSASSTPVGWQGTGGTSGTAPLWAAVIALADASGACHGSPIGFANPALYRAAAVGEGSLFHDITSGNNDFTSANGGRYPAGPAYDLASGLGSPDASALAAALCARALRLVNPGAQVSFAHTSTTLRLTVADAPGAGLHTTAAGLPQGLSINASTGRISGRPRHAGGTTVTVLATDGDGSVRSVRFRWTIHGLPAVSRAALRAVATGRPTLALTVAAGRGEPLLHGIAVKLPPGLRFAARPRALTLTAGTRRLRYAAVVSHGVLLIRLRTPSRRVRIGIGRGALLARPALAGALARGTHPRLTLVVGTSDIGGSTASVPVTIRPAS
jgi:hypothetical protein